jgi:hypothetical protein
MAAQLQVNTPKVSQSVATRSVDKIGAFGGVSGRTVEKIAAVVARPGPPLQIAYRNSEKRDRPMVADATKKFRAGGVRVGLGADFTEKCYAAVTSAFQTRGGFPMKSLVVAAALATFTLSPASAQTTACTGENLAKMTDRVYAMPYGPKKMAATREIAIANAHASRGDMRGACAHYGAALSIESNASGHFEHLHFE